MIETGQGIQRPAAPEVGGFASPLLRRPAPGVVFVGVPLLCDLPALMPVPLEPDMDGEEDE